MKLGQNVHFDDRNLLELPNLNFFQNFPIFPDFPIFPQKRQFWVNFGLKFPIGKPNSDLLVYWYDFYYYVSIIR